MDVISIITLFGLTIVLGYIGSLIFNKTKIPDIIWLLIFGLAVASFGLVDRAIFIAISPLLAALAILIILFDAGLNMDFYQMVHGFSRSFLLAILGMIFSIVVVTFLSMLLLGFDLMKGLLLGAILGGTSSPIVISLVNKMRIKENVKTFLSLESIITDPMVIVITIALIHMMIPISNYQPLHHILSAFSIGAVVGLIIGVIWLFVLDKIKGRPFDYMLTLAMLFLIYALVEYSGGSGAIASLLFGLVLGNGKTFSKILKLGKKYIIPPLLKTFQGEISFFIRSFFFVYLGLIVVISPSYLIYGIVIAVALIIVRLLAVQISIIKMDLTKREKNIMRTMAPRGLAAAVLAQLALSYGIRGVEMFSSMIFIVIFSTVIYTSICSIILHHKHKHEERKEEIEKDEKEVKERKHKRKKKS